MPRSRPAKLTGSVLRCSSACSVIQGYALASDLAVAELVIQWVARQVRAETSAWAKYGERDETRREHLQELRAYLGLLPFGLSERSIMRLGS